MFFLLGMTWTLDILGWALMVYDQKNLGFKISKILIDLINSLQGVILLSVMYFNSANLKRIKRWWQIWKEGRKNMYLQFMMIGVQN